jgi:hypothetical protein
MEQLSVARAAQGLGFDRKSRRQPEDILFARIGCEPPGDETEVLQRHHKFAAGNSGCYSASATWTAATCTPAHMST